MITSYLANITQSNYEAFRRVVQDIPTTFEAFSHLRTQMAVDLQSKGHKVIMVDLDPNKFSKYCRTTDSASNLHALDGFAFQIGTRKQE